MVLLRFNFGGIAALACAAIFGFAASAQAEWVWDKESGWIDMSARPATSESGRYGYATGLLIRGDCAAAADAFSEIEKQYPQSPYGAKAKFGRARAEARRGRLQQATEICAQLLNDKPQGVKIEEIAAFQLAAIRGLSPSSPQRSAELLAGLAGQEIGRNFEYETQIEQGDTEERLGHEDEARQYFERAIESAADAESKNDALFRAAVADLLASRNSGQDATRLRRAEGRLRQLLSASALSPTAEKAQEYLWLIRGVLSESNAERRGVYYAAIGWLGDPRYDKGCAPFKRAAKRFAGTPAGETARFYQAEHLFREGAYWTIWPWNWSAFDAYEKFMKEYPASVHVRTVIKREFAIGRIMYERGERSRTVTIMEAVAHNDPSGPLADEAQMYVGRAELDAEHFEEARLAFDAVAQGHPRSEWNSAAVYLGGTADLRATGFANDREMLLARARRSFELYVQNAPNGPFANDAQKALKDCKEKQAEDMMMIARFYERQDHPQSAAVYFRLLLKEHPDSPLSASTRHEASGEKKAP